MVRDYVPNAKRLLTLDQMHREVLLIDNSVCPWPIRLVVRTTASQAVNESSILSWVTRDNMCGEASVMDQHNTLRSSCYRQFENK